MERAKISKDKVSIDLLQNWGQSTEPIFEGSRFRKCKDGLWIHGPNWKIRFFKPKTGIFPKIDKKDRQIGSTERINNNLVYQIYTTDTEPIVKTEPTVKPKKRWLPTIVKLVIALMILTISLKYSFIPFLGDLFHNQFSSEYSWQTRGIDFWAYYNGSKAFIDYGVDPYDNNQVRGLIDQGHLSTDHPNPHMDIRAQDLFSSKDAYGYVASPINLFIFYIFTKFSFVFITNAWMVVSIVGTALVFFLFIKKFYAKTVANAKNSIDVFSYLLIAFSAFIAFYFPFLQVVGFNQINILFFLPLGLGIYIYYYKSIKNERMRSLLVSFLFAFATAVKLFPGIIICYFLIKSCIKLIKMKSDNNFSIKAWLKDSDTKIFLYSSIFTLLLFGLPIIFLGMGIFAHWITKSLSGKFAFLMTNIDSNMHFDNYFRTIAYHIGKMFWGYGYKSVTFIIYFIKLLFIGITALKLKVANNKNRLLQISLVLALLPTLAPHWWNLYNGIMLLPLLITWFYIGKDNVKWHKYLIRILLLIAYCLTNYQIYFIMDNYFLPGTLKWLFGEPMIYTVGNISYPGNIFFGYPGNLLIFIANFLTLGFLNKKQNICSEDESGGSDGEDKSESKDIGGILTTKKHKKEINPHLKGWLKQNETDIKVIDYYLEGEKWVPYKVEYKENYTIGVNDKGKPLTEDKYQLSEEEQGRLKKTLSSCTYDETGKIVRFRVVLGETAVAWRDSIDHSSLVHVGERTATIWFGERLFRDLLSRAEDPLRKKIFSHEKEHLLGKHHVDKGDEYKKLVREVHERCNTIERNSISRDLPTRIKKQIKMPHFRWAKITFVVLCVLIGIQKDFSKDSSINITGNGAENRSNQVNIYDTIDASEEEIQNALPIKIIDVKNQKGHTTLTWNFSLRTGSTKYYIYRSYFPGRHHAKVNPTPLKVQTFRDPVETLGGYRYYIIQAVDKKGKTIGLSKEIKVKVPQLPSSQFKRHFKYAKENISVDGTKLRKILTPYWPSFSEEERVLAEKLINFFDVMGESITETYRNMSAYPLRCESIALLVGSLLKETIGLNVKLATSLFGKSFFENQNFLIFSIGKHKFILDWAADCFVRGISPVILPYEEIAQFRMYNGRARNIRDISKNDLSDDVSELFPCYQNLFELFMNSSINIGGEKTDHKKELNPHLKSWLEQNREGIKVIDYYLEGEEWVPYKVEYKEDYNYEMNDRGDPLTDKKYQLSDEEQERLNKTLSSCTYDETGKKVRFRIVLGETAVAWRGSIDHSSLVHVGERAKIVWFGEGLFRNLLSRAEDSLRKEIFNHEKEHLLGKPDVDEGDEYKKLVHEVHERCDAIEQNSISIEKARIAFQNLGETAKESNELCGEQSKLAGIIQHISKPVKLKFAVPVNVLKNAGDITLALKNLGKSNIPFELIVYDIETELEAEGLKKYAKEIFGLSENVSLVTITKSQIGDKPAILEKMRAVKGLIEIKDNEYLAIATDMVAQTEANGLKETLTAELTENVSIRVIVETKEDRALSLSAILSSWLKNTNSSIDIILPILVSPQELRERLESQMRYAWKILSAA